MTLFINNEVVSRVLTMQDTIDVLEKAYRDLADGEGFLYTATFTLDDSAFEDLCTFFISLDDSYVYP